MEYKKAGNGNSNHPQKVYKSYKFVFIVKPHAAEITDVAEAIINVLDSRLACAKIKNDIAFAYKYVDIEFWKKFYEVHKDRPFYNAMCSSMSDKTAVLGTVTINCGETDIEANLKIIRESIIGKTDPAQAAPGTIRMLFGLDIEKNAIHFSDSIENGEKEYFIIRNVAGI